MKITYPHAGKLTKSLEPKEFESRLYDYWNTNHCFESSDEPVTEESFCIVIPPPNVTGSLHMGHALTNTIQDILVRWKRMSGDNTLWLPGTDHAGIATQNQVEKQIAKEGKGPTGKPLTRHDLGREKFLERTWQWKEEHGSKITHQLKRLGSSLDWKRERFTMDEGLSRAVREVFVKLYEQKLIYRGNRIINWCTRCMSALSDLEVIPKDRKGHFYHLKYPIVEKNGQAVLDDQGTPIVLVIATTRPETLLGDSAVAVHPEDERYLLIHGKFAKLPITGRLIPVITDEYVDREFGSGALKVTPSHDFNDYELGNKHQLEFIHVMGKEGKMESHLLTMGPEAAVYAGLKFKEAREKIVEDLKLRDELLKVEDHAHKVGECERCQTVAEPMISKQWFVKIEPLAKPAIHAVETGQIEFSPKSWEKTYFEWMYNIRDWCISRQLWWGHQIPAWYCDACDAITVSRQAPQQCSGCHQDATHLKQDEDVLDTWFSSALWPFSTLGWPDQTRALKTFYPTSILETGFDIIFFWVARMIMMGIHFMGEVPFKKVYLHAMVRDEKGEKMSKSKGNVIDPLELIDQHGADALRFTLAAMAGQGRDIKLSTDRVEGYRAFGNKLWNAVKFFHLQIQEPQEPFLAPPEGLETWVMNHFDSLPVTHQATIVRFHEAIQKVEHGLVHFELNESAQALYEFIWLEFCDWFIEFSKLSLKSLEKTSEHAPSGERQATLYVLHYLLDQSLKALHPFMPFLTEELWQSLPVRTSAKNVVRESLGYAEMDTLMLQSYPKTNVKLIHELPGAKKALEEVGAIKTIVEAIRNFRGENNISPKIEFDVWVQGNKKIPHQEIIMTLSKIKSLQALSPGQVLGEMESVIVLQSLGLELKINLDGLVNKEEEIKRLKKEMDKAIADREHSEAKLSRESFIQKAPAALVAQEKKTVEELKSKEAELKKALERLGVVS